VGAWGTGLYSDDVAQDVREEYKELLKVGLSNEEATQKLIKDSQWLINDMYDGPVFWFVLADTQWKLGRLLPEVKEKVIQYIQDGEHLKMWSKENPKLGLKRKEVLDKLLNQLNSPMPETKKISTYKYYRNDWKLGDTYAYQLNGDFAKDNGLDGRYIIIHKIGDHEERKGIDKDVFPIIHMKITPDKNLPKNVNEIEACEYIRLNRNNNDKKFDYTSYLWETSSRFFNKLIYVGNYSITPPTYECTTRYYGILFTTLSKKRREDILLRYYISNKHYIFK
jgi:hypothetical protein